MKYLKHTLAVAISFSVVFTTLAQVKHVILISIDGFHPDMYLDKNWPTPNLQYMMKQGPMLTIA